MNQIAFKIFISMMLVSMNIQMDVLFLRKPENLMIVAHPDDETLWGGEQLRKENYYVVCLTNGDNSIRRKEFYEVLQLTHDSGMILHYPDKVNGKRSEWKKERTEIEKELEHVMTMRKWKKIVTHNPEGEYGHQHHKYTNQIVTQIAKKHHYEALYYFGHYMKKSEIESLGKKPYLNENAIQWKGKVMKHYRSQSKVDEKLRHMYGFEKLILAQDWNE